MSFDSTGGPDQLLASRAPPRPSDHQSRRQASRSRRRLPATWALRWGPGLYSTGCPTMAGSVAPSLASARAAPSRAWWPTLALQPADVGAARHGGHAPRHRLLWLQLCASLRLAGPGGGCGLGPSNPRPPTPSLSLVGGSSQLPARGREVNGHSHRKFCCCLSLLPFPWSRRTIV